MSLNETAHNDFITLITQNEKLIYKVCNLYASGTADLRDLFQEIVLQAWISYPKFNQASKISTWLYRVAINTALNHKRKEQKLVHMHDIDAFAELEDKIQQPYAENYKIMHRLITTLPALEKALILLYLEEKSHQEIAEIMGLSVSNVGTRLGRIKEKLKQQAKQFVN